MLCTCSGEHFQFEDKPRSPESLATRDFSVSCLSSSRTGDRESKFDDNSEVDDVESALRETISLNYEEARALLGRLEYQRGNFNAALQVFEGIDIRGLRPRMIKAISERFRRKGRAKGGFAVEFNVDAFDAAVECKFILDIVESAWPHGVPNGIEDECKLIEMFHKALELLPNLWIQAGCLEEAVLAYRRALIRPWNLDFTKWASLQKDLAVILLYSGSEITLPAECRQVSGFITPSNNVEEAILLLFILMRKLAFQEISWDPDIMSHLTFALSLSGQFELLASYVEQLLPGTYSRAERWYILALCYCAAGMDEDALNILKKVVGHCQKEHKPHIPSLLLGAKLCCKVPLYALEGIKFATKAIDSVKNQEKHLVGVASHLLGACYGCCSKSSISDSERLKLRDNALKLLNNAAKIEKYDPEVIYSLGRESLMQRNLNAAVENATKYLDMVDGSSVIGWKLLALVISAQQNLKEAEAIVELAIDETEKAGQLDFFRLKALLQDAQGQSKSAIDTYRISLAIIQAQKELQIWHPKYECLEKAKSINSSFPKIWHITGLLLEAQSMHEEALAAFSVALSIQPNFVPSMVSMAEILRMLGGESLPIARSFLMNAIRLDPTNHEAWLNLGIISKMEGSLHQAADCFQAAYELRQSSPVHNFE
uniref:Uncharacterized protein n=1 Tax=Ananas comosus var. bracteatus TaxID=296719 RepID=A0A6V7Q4L0_ANACO|nr:unnamed protein product [Ananas comosus var. bracteatus]